MEWNFQGIHSKDINKLKPFFELRSNKTCDSVFLDTYLWKDTYQAEYMICNQEAVIWKVLHEGQYMSCVPLCSEEKLNHYFKLTEKYFHEVLNKKPIFNLVDEDSLKSINLDTNKYIIKELEDAADYIYDAESLRTLKGKKYQKKRNHVNKFIKDYEGRFEYRTLNASHKNLIWNFLLEWKENHGDDLQHHIETESKGIRSILESFTNLDASMGGVFIDGKLRAFSIGSYNTREKMAIIHIEKADHNVNGLYPYINQQFLVHEYPDALIVNREDDMGLEGLRKAKRSYYPIKMARKFLVYEK